ncbi:DUF493 family protein [Desulfohalovibrio reitneri]|uniref:DUF493 family protein n=1 Tax=Desulfohalovibrio reitneri TaxID=1307759 RepID=UPI0004A6B523|nr:DUF493 family protein [Desulfohalovibrio reitneri]
MADDSLSRLRDTLEQCEDWPCEYTFKFIVPCQNVDQVLSPLEEGFSISTRESRTGKYISVTAVGRMACADDVIEVYQRMDGISGLIPL